MRTDCEGPLHPQALEGIRLFNAGRFFEAHEALEAAWRAEPGPVRRLYQGILQVAVFHLHLERGNPAGALKVLLRGMEKLNGLPDHCRGVDVAALRADAAEGRFAPIRLT